MKRIVPKNFTKYLLKIITNGDNDESVRFAALVELRKINPELASLEPRYPKAPSEIRENQDTPGYLTRDEAEISLGRPLPESFLEA